MRRTAMRSDASWTALRARKWVLLIGGLVSTAVLGTGSERAVAACGGPTARISVGITGQEANGRSELPTVDADGCIVAFKSSASNLIANDVNGKIDVFVVDRNSGITTRIPPRPDTDADPNANSYPPALDADGGIVAFGSEASNLVQGDFNSSPDMFAYDRTSNVTQILSLVNDFAGDGRGGGRVPDAPASISADGSLVTFTSSAADLVPNDTNELNDVFVRNRMNGSIELMSVATVGGNQGDAANGASAGGAISADGCVVGFYSDANNVVGGDTNQARDVFVRDRCAGDTERVSVSTNGDQANGPSQVSGNPVAVSADGRYVAFASDASNLVDSDDNGFRDVFVRDRQNGVTILVSKGANGDAADGPSQFPSISADGRFVAFQSAATNLVSDDTNGHTDVFVADLTDGSIRRVSVTDAGQEANGDSYDPRISADGDTVVYQSDATNLVAGDTNGFSDVFASVNPLAGALPTPTDTPSPTVSATTASTATATPTPSASPTITAGGGTATATATPTTPTGGSTTPTPTTTGTTPSGGMATPTPSHTMGAPTTGTMTPTSQTATPSATGGGGSGASGGGGGCSCRIDPGSGVPTDSGLLPAILLPLLLWTARGWRRRR